LRWRSAAEEFDQNHFSNNVLCDREFIGYSQMRDAIRSTG
jgi:hypothetical protein